MKERIKSYYNFHNDLRVAFSTDNPEFFSFVEQNLEFFKDNNVSSPDLVVEVNFSEKDDTVPERRVAKNIFFNKEELIYRDKNGFKIFAKEGNPFKVKVFVWKQFVRDLYNLVFSGKSAKEEKFLTVMRYSLYLPLFYLLESKGYSLFHGSAVEKEGKAYLFVGANHVGKTTISLNLISNYGFKLLSDDFLAVKDDKVFAFPDKIRATKFTLESVSNIKTDGNMIYSKHHIVLPKEKISSFARPEKIFFLQTGDKAQVKEMEPKTMQKMISAVHSYLKEFPENSYLSFLPGMVSLGEIQERQGKALAGKKLFSFQASCDIKESIKLLLDNLN